VRQIAHALFWFRRDLRLTDNAGLYHALERSQRVSCFFVLDREILDALSNKKDRRVEFIRESLAGIECILRRHGSTLTVLHGRPVEEVPALAARLKASAVFANHDYEPDALRRDRAVAVALTQIGVEFITRKDQVIFERDEVLTQSGEPFLVFTPYKNAWLKRLTHGDLQAP
jgi:deoxyribodipyrimidine photo-lyase